MTRSLNLLFLLSALATVGSSATEELAAEQPTSPDPRFVAGPLLASDRFDGNLDQWRSELEKGGSVAVKNGHLEIDVPGGCSVWFKTPFEGPLLISYDAIAVKAQGPNDRVSDLNCFWMARDARSPNDLFATAHSGKFSDYDALNCYYVGQGGNTNKTTRFRRYIGEPGNRPLLPEHDLSTKPFLLVPNLSQKIQLVAAGSTIAYYRDGQRIFVYEDPHPYTSGWFAFRTTASHLQISHFSVARLQSK